MLEDKLQNPPAITLLMLSKVCNAGLAAWLLDRKNSRQIPHRMKTAGYVAYRNPDAKDGQWKVAGKRQTVYVQETLAVPERHEAAKGLAEGANR